MDEAASRAEPPRKRRPTATANFGSSRRESHDASGFYGRFVPPTISNDSTVLRPRETDVIYLADARDMSAVESSSVALVVTSPPYFAGKEYEEDLGRNGSPANYFEYLDMLRAVFSECARVLEPGGRIAVNVANLGRRPYRSLSGDVSALLQGLGLLLRGEVVWWKARAAGGSCAWGTYQQPSNPVLRDVTERVVVASKGRFDRALRPEERARLGLPHVATISRDEFLEATTDLWEIPPESARRVGHPAPFPVELPLRFIELYTYESDVVLDPFMGAGSTAVAAVRAGRHFIGFDNDRSYVELARARALEALAKSGSRRHGREVSPDALAVAVREGKRSTEIAEIVLREAGFRDVKTQVRYARAGVEVSLAALDGKGRPFAFEVCGALTTTSAGLRRADVLWRVAGKAAALHFGGEPPRFVVLEMDARSAKVRRLPAALANLVGAGRPITAVVDLLDPTDRARLKALACGGEADA